MEEAQSVLEPEVLREEIKKEYAHVATNPEDEFHFHTEGVWQRYLNTPKNS